MMHYKTSFQNQNYVVDFLKPSFLKHGIKTIPESLTELRGISSSKRDKIHSILRGGVTSADKSFWVNIQCNDNSEDLCSSREKFESNAQFCEEL